MKVYGPYTRKDGRSHVIVIDSGKRRTVSYPKFLVEECIGRPLLDNEEVHHKDRDFTNNDLSNLEVKEVSKHRRDHKIGMRSVSTWICPECGSSFEREDRYTNYNQFYTKLGAGPFCSRKCAGVHNAYKGLK